MVDTTARELKFKVPMTYASVDVKQAVRYTC